MSNPIRSADGSVTDARMSRQYALERKEAAMKGRDETERIPYLRVGTTILKRVLMPLSNGRNVETLIP